MDFYTLPHLYYHYHTMGGKRTRAAETAATKQQLRELAKSVEDLALATKRGFDTTASKQQFEVLVDKIRLLRADFKDLAASHKLLVSLVAIHDRGLNRLKEHAGI